MVQRQEKKYFIVFGLQARYTEGPAEALKPWAAIYDETSMTAIYNKHMPDVISNIFSTTNSSQNSDAVVRIRLQLRNGTVTLCALPTTLVTDAPWGFYNKQVYDGYIKFEVSTEVNEETKESGMYKLIVRVGSSTLHW